MAIEQVFVSHTQKDEKFCDVFDRVCARVGIKAFRSEFESITLPAWKTIKDAMGKSCALFFLIGKNLVESQEKKEPDWMFTQNWIAYEIGLACQRNIDVWAICDDVDINFPMPYINNYINISLGRKDAFDYVKWILTQYKNSTANFAYPHVDDEKQNWGVACPYEDCKMKFNLHVYWEPATQLTCPQCLRPIILEKGHPGK
jgi:hypothetical protein